MVSANLLTIVIPAYNYAEYLERAIISCIESNVGVELIVVNNASTDGTRSVLAKFEGLPHFSCYHNPRLLPVQENWNYAVSLVRTRWVKLLQADDYLLPGAVKRLVELVHHYDNFDFIGHYAVTVGSKNQLINSRVMHGSAAVSLDSISGLKAKIRQKYRFKEPTSNIFRKDMWATLGGYSSQRRFTFDVQFNVRIIASGRSVLIPERLAAVRRHSNSDGARLPLLLAIDELKMLGDEIVGLLGERASWRDRGAMVGWIQFRLLELCSQKFKKSNREVLKLLHSRGLLLLNFNGWWHFVVLCARRIVRGDIQGYL